MPLLQTQGAASARGYGFGGIFVAKPSQQEYTTPGTYSWIAPPGVRSVSVLAIAGGGGGGVSGGAGGGCAYLNNISVTPGVSYTVVVGNGGNGTTGNASYGLKGGNSSFNVVTVIATSGSNTSDGAGTGGSYSGTGVSGYKGGISFTYIGSETRGGNAGNNSDGEFQALQFLQQSSGGTGSTGGVIGGAGGGGSGGTSGFGGGGGGGSGLGYTGSSSNGSSAGSGGGSGGSFGGGGGGATADALNYGGSGGVGAVRIIWPGTTRQFPSTNTGNL